MPRKPRVTIEPTPARPRDVLACSFCGADKSQTPALIAGPVGIYICCDCASLAGEVAQDVRNGKDPLHGKPPELLWAHPERVAFMTALHAKLDLGAATYGQRSFSRSPKALIVELEQEALDLAGWGYVLWRRLQIAKQAAATLVAGESEEVG